MADTLTAVLAECDGFDQGVVEPCFPADVAGAGGTGGTGRIPVFFFDRSWLAFEMVLDAYRLGKLHIRNEACKDSHH